MFSNFLSLSLRGKREEGNPLKKRRRWGTAQLSASTPRSKRCGARSVYLPSQGSRGGPGKGRLKSHHHRRILTGINCLVGALLFKKKDTYAEETGTVGFPSSGVRRVHYCTLGIVLQCVLESILFPTCKILTPRLTENGDGNFHSGRSLPNAMISALIDGNGGKR